MRLRKQFLVENKNRNTCRCPGCGTMIDIVFGQSGNATDATVLGWSAPEDGYTWTVGHRAVLCAERPDAPDGYVLDITWSPYLAAQRVTISAGGRRIAAHVVRDLESVTFACPPPQRHERRLLIEFDLPDAAAPSAVEGHHDDRLLALCFRWIKILPAAARPPALSIAAEGDAPVTQHRRGWPAPSRAHAANGAAAGTDIIFGTDGNAGPFTREGWSTPEPGYLWTSGARSRLVLPRPPDPGAWDIEAEVAPFTHENRLTAQRLGLSVNGVPAGAVQLHSEAVVKLELSPALASADALDLVFDLPDAARPMDFAGGTDDRALGVAFKRLVLTPAAAAPPASLPRPALRLVEPSVVPADQLMLGFESLGENCEFGLVQRRCGAEPLGLLRFASAPLPQLLAALHARFDGLGSPESIGVELSSNGREYMIRDAAFGFYWHAWVLAGEKTPAEIRDREARRVPFLIRKLTEDLASGEKIFVYHGMQPLSGAHARALTRAIRLYGPSTLLWVELADASHACGTVEWVSEGLMKGFIERFAPGDDAHDFDTEAWVAVCRAARAIYAA
jgi:hypothetical protein